MREGSGVTTGEFADGDAPRPKPNPLGAGAAAGVCAAACSHTRHRTWLAHVLCSAEAAKPCFDQKSRKINGFDQSIL